MERHLTMKKKLFLVASIIILLGLAVICVHGIRRVDSQALDIRIQQELPPGSDEKDVVAFLDSNRISHSDYSSESQAIYGEIPKSRVGLINSSVHVMFGFDEHGKLIRHTVVELRKWP